jgi:hypothetical protein
MLAGQVFFSGHLKTDLRFHVCNNHAIVSMFAAHKDHPYDKTERTLVEASLLSFGFFLSTVMHPSDSAVSVGVSIVIAISTFVWVKVLTTIAKCSCCYYPWCPTRCTRSAKSCATMALKYICFVSVLIFGLGGYFRLEDVLASQGKEDPAAARDRIVNAWIASRIEGYILSFPFLIVFGKLTWNSQKTQAEETIEALNKSLLTGGVTPFMVNFEQGEENENRRSDAEAQSTDAALQMLALARKHSLIDEPAKIAHVYFEFIDCTASGKMLGPASHSHSITMLHVAAFEGWFFNSKKQL